MPPGVQQGYLALADISGYTRFMAEVELDHAQGIMASLFGTILKKVTPAMTLAEIEGDALFLYTPVQKMSRGEMLMELVESAYVEFRRRQQTMTRNADCPCKACQSISALDLKFVAHYGEYIVQDISGKPKPVGSSVNLVHRLLKNSVREAVGWRGYALYTGKALERMDVYPVNTFEQVQTYEHFGDVVTYSSNLDERFRELTGSQRTYLTREDADVFRTYRIDAPPSIVWDYLEDPVKRSAWMKGSDWQSKERPAGRTGPGAKNHCANHRFIEHILDWRPFDYSTVRYERKPIKGLLLSELTPDGEGTLMEWRFRLEAPLPGAIRAQVGKFIALRMMAWNDCVDLLKRGIAEGWCSADPVQAA